MGSGGLQDPSQGLLESQLVADQQSVAELTTQHPGGKKGDPISRSGRQKSSPFESSCSPSDFPLESLSSAEEHPHLVAVAFF